MQFSLRAGDELIRLGDLSNGRVQPCGRVRGVVQMREICDLNEVGLRNGPGQKQQLSKFSKEKVLPRHTSTRPTIPHIPPFFLFFFGSTASENSAQTTTGKRTATLQLRSREWSTWTL